MATGLSMSRAVFRVVQLIPKPAARSSLVIHTNVAQCSHHSTSPILSLPRHCLTSTIFRDSTKPKQLLHLCQRQKRYFFTKWSSALSSSSKAKEKEVDHDASDKQAVKGDDIEAKGSEERVEEDEEDSVIPKTDEKGQPLSNWKRMKIMMKAYGYVIIPVHWVIAPVWFGAFYYTIKMGVDIGPFLSTVGVSDHHVESLRNSKASTALMAYALYKIFTPLRYTVTLGATEMTIRRLRKMGYMKPHPRKEKSYRDSFKETVTEMKDKVKDMRDSPS